jgi:uncharacterized Fe-S center protein
MTANDLPIIPDVGIFASFDPVALDMACVDAVNRQPVNQGSVLAEILAKEGQEHADATSANITHDHFAKTHPETNWLSCLEHAAKIGLGSMQYELIEV